LIWIYAVGMLAFASMTSVVALYLEAEFAITAKTIGYFFVYIGVLSFVMRSVLLGPVVDRIGEYKAMRLGAMALALGLLLYPAVPTLWLLIAVIPLVPIGTALLFPATTSLMSQASPPSEIGTIMGTAQTYAGFSRVLAPIGATMAFQRLGHGSPFWIAAVLVGVMGVWVFRLDRGSAADPPAPGTEAPEAP
jgi:MFS family permease